MLYAHTVPDDTEDEWQTLGEHLTNVADMAASFSASFDAEEWARLVGLVHDAGKASDAFQAMLLGRSGHVDHSTAGAQLLQRRYPKVGSLLAYLVAGHHGGLPNGIETGARSSLRERLEKEIEPYDAFFELEGLVLPDAQDVLRTIPPWMLQASPSKERAEFSLSFLLRMLYSSLVDADFLDTERVMDPERFLSRVYQGMTLSQMKDNLARKMESLAADLQSTRVNAARTDIHNACLEAAGGEPGIYTLTVPTGGGKTLSSLDFALNHALTNGQERVIYAIPFTSIIEQTAGTFKGLFGPESVLEHHSSYEFPDDDEDGRAARERLAMENWDVPLVVTTNVQLFESIYSDKPSRCRKNHNLANSVIVLDEAQSIPDKVLAPCLAALEELANNYSTTIVLCTATQPALDAVWPFGSSPREIVPEARRHERLFGARTHIESIGERSVASLADEIASLDEVLCVVSSRWAASSLYNAVIGLVGAGGAFHLSAMMVPAHRSAVIAEVRERLKLGKTCRVISTQLIEAGVDVDFPVVYREIAGIDSILQAAGRCNRDGRRPVGLVEVFDCPETAVTRRGWLARMRTLGLETIASSPDPFGNDGIRSFFMARYQVEDTDELGIIKSFEEDPSTYPFEECGDKFRLIDDGGISIFVPWGMEGRLLLERIRSDDVDIRTSRSIQRYTVTVPNYIYEELEKESAVVRYPGSPFNVLEPLGDDLSHYSDEKGLSVEAENTTLIL